jgi:hypothetical protein
LLKSNGVGWYLVNLKLVGLLCLVVFEILTALVMSFALQLRVFFGSRRSGVAAETGEPEGSTNSSLGRQVAARCSGFFRNWR